MNTVGQAFDQFLRGLELTVGQRDEATRQQTVVRGKPSPATTRSRKTR